jgi:osmoprotectant transport system permease protein
VRGLSDPRKARVEALGNWFTYVQDNLEFILEEVVNHLQIVAISVGVATVVAVLLGAWAQSRPIVRALALSITGIFLTIPSLALFALFIPLFGIGNRPAIVALVLYGLLPILRNTVTGLDSVSPAVVESARGMGMSPRQQLLKVRLPLAFPVVMAGIRVSTLLIVGLTAIAVLVGGDGLGSFIQDGLTRNGFPNAGNAVVVGVVFTVALGLVLDAVLATVQRVFTPRGLLV